MQKVGMIHKKTSVNIYLTYFFEFFLTKLADSLFITWNVLGLSVWKQIYDKILPVVKQPSSMLSSTTWRLTLKSTNLFNEHICFSHWKLKPIFLLCLCVVAVERCLVIDSFAKRRVAVIIQSHLFAPFSPIIISLTIELLHSFVHIKRKLDKRSLSCLCTCSISVLHI